MANDQIAPLIVAFVGLVLYIGLIILGIRLAKSKNRSPHWMWFAIHPLGLIIVLIVIASISPLRRCPHCAEKLKAHARICSYCGYRFSANSIGSTSSRQELASSVAQAAGSLGNAALAMLGKMEEMLEKPLSPQEHQSAEHSLDSLESTLNTGVVPATQTQDARERISRLRQKLLKATESPAMRKDAEESFAAEVRCGGCGSRELLSLEVVKDKNNNRGYLCSSCKKEYGRLLQPESIRRFWMCGACGFRILAGTKIDAAVDPESKCPNCGGNVNSTLVNLSDDRPVKSGLIGEPMD